MKNALYNENALEGLNRVEDKSVQAICTDPPYHQGLTSNGNNLKPECREAILHEVKGTVQGVLEVYVRYLSEYLTKVIRYYGLRLNPNEVMQSLL